MGKTSRSHIVNIGSMGGFQGSLKFSGLSWYSASKAAISNLTECLSEELKGSNISVNCLALGAVQTEMLSKAFPGYKAPVSAKKIGHFIADFALNKPYIFNGQVIPVTLSNP
jgi:short-subunit dehydrogenase